MARRRPIGQTQCPHELQRNHHGQRQESAGHTAPVQYEKEQEHRQRQQKMDQMTGHRHNGQQGYWEARTLDQVAVLYNGAGSLAQGGLKPGPDEQSAEEKRGIPWDAELQDGAKKKTQDQQLA